MEKCKQLAIFLANKPGTLANVCTSLAEKGINIQGIMVSDAVDHAVVRLVVSNPQEAIHMLGEAGLLVVDSDIISIHLNNKPGELANLGYRLSEAGVNIEYLYGSLNSKSLDGVLYIKVNDIDKAAQALGEMNY